MRHAKLLRTVAHYFSNNRFPSGIFAVRTFVHESHKHLKLAIGKSEASEAHPSEGAGAEVMRLVDVI
jgi:hypothetical protein